MALEITSSNFETIAQSDKLVVIDFWAPWCGPCRALAPTIDELAEMYEGKAIIGKCNTDAEDALVNQFGIHSIPVLIFLKNGEVKDIFQAGGAKKSDLIAKIDALL